MNVKFTGVKLVYFVANEFRGRIHAATILAGSAGNQRAKRRVQRCLIAIDRPAPVIKVSEVAHLTAAVSVAKLLEANARGIGNQFIVIEDNDHPGDHFTHAITDLAQPVLVEEKHPQGQANQRNGSGKQQRLPLSYPVLNVFHCDTTKIVSIFNYNLADTAPFRHGRGQ